MLNKVVLIGRLVRDPEGRTTATGKTLCDFTIAVAKRIKPQDGSPDADFFRCVCWERQADYVMSYLTKGRLVAVEGRLQSRKYTTSDGQNREVVEVVADNVQGLDRPKDEQGDPPSQAHKADPPAVDEPYDPFAQE